MATRSNRNGSDNNSVNKNLNGSLSKREMQQLQKGLPNDEAREAMAQTYLEIQTRDWPELVKSGILPEFTDKNVNQLAEDFKTAFLNDDRNMPPSKQGSTVACTYVRFSDDNSNFRSLAQQLRNILNRANQERIFIEWEHICADAAVSGTDTSRRDYQRFLGWIQDSENDIDFLFFDDISRLNRIMAATVSLSAESEQKSVVLIGVSDGFDSRNENSKLILSMYASMSEMFIDGLRSKVKRGMTDGFTQGKNLQPPSFGYELIMLKDQNGEPLLNRHGKPKKKKVIKEEDRPWVIKAFELFAVKKWSRERIAKHFNHHNVGGKTTWDSSRVKQLLRRSVYRGVECYGMSSQKKDPNTGKVTVINHPESKWQIREVSELEIVKYELWMKAQERLDESLEVHRRNHKGTNKKPRCEHQPTLLIRPVCGYCGSRLILGHSSKYQSFCCHNGKLHKNGCQLKKYKSVRIVNQAILNKLHEVLFTENFFKQMMQEANQFLVELAQRPQEDVTQIEKQIQNLKKKNARLTNVVMEQGEEGLETLVLKIRELDAELKELQQEREQVKQRNAAPPPPLDIGFVKQCLKDVEKLLKGCEKDKDAEDENEKEKVKNNVPLAATILEALTGPIKVTQGEAQEGQRGVPWFAEFSYDSTRFMVELSRSKQYPSTGTWEFLYTHGWTKRSEVSLEVREIPKYEELGPVFLELYENGASIQSIADAHEVNWGYVEAAINFMKTGERPQSNKVNSAKRKSGPPRIPIYKQIAEDVSRLHSEELMSFRKIVQWLREHRGITTSAKTVNRAWDYKHPKAVQQAAKNGVRPNRGKSSRLGVEKINLIHKLLNAGKSPKEVAQEVGCGVSTVKREQKRMK